MPMSVSMQGYGVMGKEGHRYGFGGSWGIINLWLRYPFLAPGSIANEESYEEQ